jgi:hypothetical protein
VRRVDTVDDPPEDHAHDGPPFHDEHATGRDERHRARWKQRDPGRRTGNSRKRHDRNPRNPWNPRYARVRDPAEPADDRVTAGGNGAVAHRSLKRVMGGDEE